VSLVALLKYIFAPTQIITIPFDTAKVRLQIQGEQAKYNGMLHCIKTMAAE
jgi:hypothetical protein